VGGGRSALSSFDTLLARHDLEVLRETLADVSKSVGNCSSSQCAERGLKDNAASPSKLSFRCSAASSHPATHSLIARFKYLSTLQPEASLPGVPLQERSSRCLGAQGLFSSQRLAGRILQTFPEKKGCVRPVSVPTDNGVFNQLAMSFCLLIAVSPNPQLRAATSTRVDLASDQPRDLAVKWTVDVFSGSRRKIVRARSSNFCGLAPQRLAIKRLAAATISS